MKRERVVVTGLSALTCIGLSATKMWEALIEGQCGASPVEGPLFEESGGIACQIKDFKPQGLERFDRASQLAIRGVQDAIEDARIDRKTLVKAPVLVGTTMSGFFAGSLEKAVLATVVTKDEPAAMLTNGENTRYKYCSSISEAVISFLELSGVGITIPTACAAGNYAIAIGAQYIERGTSEVVICGGADAFSPIAFFGFSRLKAMAAEICRPFDVDRDGLLVSEGSAFLVLESLSAARKRNANIYAEVVGYGMSCDGYHITAPHPGGKGAQLAMKRALGWAKIRPDKVNYICAHGTGTFANDRMEAKAIHAVFGETVRTVPVSSIKSSIGHAMGAASAIEAVVSILALKNQFIPPTLYCYHPDPEFAIRVICRRGEYAELTYVLSNAFAFGGNNAVIVLKQWK